MPTFKDLSAAIKYIKSAIDDTLENEVADAVKEEQTDAVKRVVYGAYGSKADGEPKQYVRRKESGGLADPNNMVPTVVDGVLEVWNITPVDNGYGNDGYLAGDIVYSGGPYNYSKGKDTFGDFRQPRDFIGGTYENLRASKSYLTALKSGLQKRGLKVE